jgi:hypothetical protein
MWVSPMGLDVVLRWRGADGGTDGGAGAAEPDISILGPLAAPIKSMNLPEVDRGG